MQHILGLERAVEHLQARLRDVISASPEAVAHLEDGVIVRANPAWASRFGFQDPDAVIGLPLAHLFAETERSELKEALQSAAQKDPDAPALARELHTAAGGETPVTVELSPLPGEGPSRLQMAIRGKEAPAGSESQNEELERTKNWVATEIQALDRDERKVNVLSPLSFASIAAERLNRPLEDSIRALVTFRPADLAEACRVLGPLGIAGVGDDFSGILSPMLDAGDVATRVDELNLLVLVDRKDKESLHTWIESALHTLASHVVEAGPRSTHVGFVAGYATADGIQQLEALVRRAQHAAKGPENTVHSDSPETRPPATETDGVAWNAFIPEALEERRFAVSLTPIQDITHGSKLYEAIPCLLDRAGHEIGAEVFYGPAGDLGLLTNIERRLLGYAMVAQTQLRNAGKSTRMLVPLSAGALDDPGLPALLRSLGSDPTARPALESLVIEFEQDDIAGRIRDVERMSREFAELGCGLGIRNFVPTRSTERLLDDLKFATLRLAPDLMERLAGDEVLRNSLCAIAQRSAQAGTVVIATAVANPDAMAMLYNLGIGTVEGPVAGTQSLYRFQNGNRPGRSSAANEATAGRVEDTVTERIAHLEPAAA